ncbi:glycoside hydrolase family 2 protein [Plenodomus tracheiphilus IPT5]|uniref:Glycoside hydrolase family 2 protein n=1 Tax=Plenodomus tracheiphilus IPT5 TaxID=1408161 RepID=A0A6A7BMP8_9PLEO|nr:glycoside hydrolase family 2 protein [Plenodomus tracheiphilus IPT5]
MSEYPRPDFVRENLVWQSLDGPWSFLFDDNDVGLTKRWHQKGLPDEITVDPSTTNSSDDTIAHSITAKIAAGTQELLQGNQFKNAHTVHKKRDICVPYVLQCPASGINEQGVHEVLWYEREIEDLRTEEHKTHDHRVVLRFGAVDYEAKVWVGGHFFGGHRGGHTPFDIDITDAFVDAKTQRLTVRVFDSAHDLTQPRGKQYWKAQPESIFYTPSGGIWQSVWLEAVPRVSIGDSSTGTLLRNNDIEAGKVHAEIQISNRPAGHKYSIEIEASLAGKITETSRTTLPRDSNTAILTISTRVSDSQKAQILEENTGTPPDPTDWLHNTALWSPEHPTLYTLTIRLFNSKDILIDTIHTTTGMRSLTWTHSTIRLNNRPYFQALFLDQGYWPTTFLTPPSTHSLTTDITLSKALGFNGCRKHQKLEDPRFLHAADQLGFLVWSEMGNAYAFSSQYMTRFDQEWREAVLRDRNHASVVAWTPVNESWAYTDLAASKVQRDHIRSLYYATKTLDQTRPVNDNCGWEHVITDLTTFHDYSDGEALTATCKGLEDGILARKAGRDMFLGALGGDGDAGDLGSRHVDGAPILCTEFGGINIARGNVETGVEGNADGNANTADRDWGYTTATDSTDLLKRIEKMMTGIVDGGLICGFVYTQLTDIEQEVNGLYTPDRKAKVDVDKVREIVEGVKRRFAELRA